MKNDWSNSDCGQIEMDYNPSEHCAVSSSGCYVIFGEGNRTPSDFSTFS